jgi:hypothetical protein
MLKKNLLIALSLFGMTAFQEPVREILSPVAFPYEIEGGTKRPVGAIYGLPGTDRLAFIPFVDSKLSVEKAVYADGDRTVLTGGTYPNFVPASSVTFSQSAVDPANRAWLRQTLDSQKGNPSGPAVV